MPTGTSALPDSSSVLGWSWPTSPAPLDLDLDLDLDQPLILLVIAIKPLRRFIQQNNALRQDHAS